MSKEILVINPRKKTRRKKASPTKRRGTKKRTTKKSASKLGAVRKKRRTTKPAQRRTVRAMSKGGTMATKRKKRKTATKAITTVRRRRSTPKRNPSRRRAVARRAGGALRELLSTKTVIDSAKATGGMLAAQFFSKKWGDVGINSKEATWKDYTVGALAGLGAGMAANMIKSGTGKEFFKGSLSLIMYKLFVNELSERSEFIEEQFGASDETVFMGTDGQVYQPGDTYLGDDGEVYLMGAGGNWQPAGYMTPETSMGETLAPVTSLGETVAPPSSLGEDPYTRTFGEDPYARVFN